MPFQDGIFMLSHVKVMFVLLHVYNIVHLVGSNKLIYISSGFTAV